MHVFEEKAFRSGTEERLYLSNDALKPNGWVHPEVQEMAVQQVQAD